MENSDDVKTVVVYNFALGNEQPTQYTLGSENKQNYNSHVAIIVFGQDGSRRIGVAAAEEKDGQVDFEDYIDQPFPNKELSGFPDANKDLPYRYELQNGTLIFGEGTKICPSVKAQLFVALDELGGGLEIGDDLQIAYKEKNPTLKQESEVFAAALSANYAATAAKKVVELIGDTQDNNVKIQDALKLYDDRNEWKHQFLVALAGQWQGQDANTTEALFGSISSYMALKHVFERTFPHMSETDFKGRFAENICRLHLQLMKYHVEEFGIEHSAPVFSNMKRMWWYPNSWNLWKFEKGFSKAPDFLASAITDNAEKDAFLVEVKYRTKFDEGDFDEIIKDYEMYLQRAPILFYVVTKDSVEARLFPPKSNNHNNTGEDMFGKNNWNNSLETVKPSINMFAKKYS